MQSLLSNQHPFPLSQHRHSSQPHLQERPPPSSVVRAQMRFILMNSRTSIYTPFVALFLQTITEDILIPGGIRLYILYLPPRRSFVAVRHCTSPCGRIGPCILPTYQTHSTCPIPYCVPHREPYFWRASKLHNWCNRAFSRHHFCHCHCRLSNFQRIYGQLAQSLEMAILFRPQRSTGISRRLSHH